MCDTVGNIRRRRNISGSCPDPVPGRVPRQSQHGPIFICFPFIYSIRGASESRTNGECQIRHRPYTYRDITQSKQRRSTNILQWLSNFLVLSRRGKTIWLTPTEYTTSMLADGSGVHPTSCVPVSVIDTPFYYCVLILEFYLENK